MENTTISGPHAYGHDRFDAQLVPCTALSSLDHLEPTKRLLSTLPPPPPYTNGGQSACNHGLPEYDRLAIRELTPPQPYSDLSRPTSSDAHDVPLGRFVAVQAYFEPEDDASCTDEAPPSYAVAVQQSYRDPLMQHIWCSHGGYGEVDEESGVGLDMQRRDDERYAVLKIVAMFAVAIILFVVSGILGWMVLGGILQ